VAEEKFPVGPVPSATLGKGVADGLLAFTKSLRLLRDLGDSKRSGRRLAKDSPFSMYILFTGRQTWQPGHACAKEASPGSDNLYGLM
jgi:hypothetical protein